MSDLTYIPHEVTKVITRNHAVRMYQLGQLLMSVNTVQQRSLPKYVFMGIQPITNNIKKWLI